MTVPLLSIGLISILAQVVILRELNVALYGIELVYLFALGLWLLWTAAGAVAGGFVRSPSRRDMAAFFILFGLILPGDIVFIRGSRLLFGGMSGTYLSFFQQLTVAALSLLPAGFLSGVLFQWTARAYIEPNRTLAAAYAVESAGGLIGGLLSTLFLYVGLANLGIALVCSLVAALTPLALTARQPSVLGKARKPVFLKLAAILLACASLALLWQSPNLDRRLNRWNHPDLLESNDSPYGRITMTRLQDQVSVFENDALAFETEGTEAEAFCHLAALQHRNPREILILGGGIEGLVREALKHRPQRIDYVELNPVLLDLVTRHLPQDIGASLKAPNVRTTVADPRRYLRTSGTYDLILVGMPEPASGQANRFYTREFFVQCAAKLKPGGILAFRLRTAENLWPLPLVRRNASIYRALQAVFPHVLFLPGTTNIVTASRAALPDAPEVMSGRLQERRIATRLVSANYIRYLFTNDRFAAIRDLLQKGTAPPNTDIRPVCYQYAFVIWLSKFFPGLTQADPTAIIDKGLFHSPFVWFAGLALPVLFLLSRLRPGFRRLLLVAVSGFLGMVAETVLILYYQVKYGVLYRDIGLLLMSFMAGLALGALAMNRLMDRPFGGLKKPRRYGAATLAGFALLCAYLAWTVSGSAAAGLVHTSILLFSAGLFVAAIFSYAALHEIEDQTRIIGPFYAADLAGGCMGSLMASLVFIPLTGMDTSAMGMLFLAVLSVLLI